MTHPGDVTRGRDTVARWCNLAERRLEHLTDMFETGRWRRFHSEQAFLENIREAKAAVETWRDLMARDAAPEHLAIDFAGAGTGRPALIQDENLLAGVASLTAEPAPIVVEPLREIPDDVLVALEIQLLDIDEAPAVFDESELDSVSLPPLDPNSIPQRYPLLHNAL